MNIVDPIYGTFRLSEPVKSLCMAPEVRRLSQIRLLNTVTPSLASLGELRRFSHTLGVLYLAAQNKSIQREGLWHEFATAVLLHDIGTPPFGHLFEYHLKERFGWSHETVIRQILQGNHVRENRAHQLFANQAIVFRSLLKETSVDTNVVERLIAKEHPLSQLIFGSLDFDNLDNVARMGWALGHPVDKESIVEISRNLGVDSTGALTLSRKYEGQVTEWLQLRRDAYNVIVFDGPTVAAQGILSNALEAALATEALNQEDWTLTDESLIELLLKEKQTKKVIALQYLGTLPEQSFVLQVKGNLLALGYTSRGDLNVMLNDLVSRTLGPGAFGYTFVDRGTFSKRVQLIDPEDRQNWQIGTTSESVIIHGFTKVNNRVNRKRNLRAVQMLIEALRLHPDSIIKCAIGADSEDVEAQQTLAVAP